MYLIVEICWKFEFNFIIETIKFIFPLSYFSPTALIRRLEDWLEPASPIPKNHWRQNPPYFILN